MKKFVAVFAVFLLLSVVRYQTLNADYPQDVEIEEKTLPVTYEQDGISFTVHRVTMDTVTRDEEEDKPLIRVVAHLTIENESAEDVPLPLVLNQMHLNNFSKTFSTIQPPIDGDDPEEIVIPADETIEFDAEYLVAKLNQEEQMVYLAIIPELYEEKYQEKLEQKILYYETIPVEGAL
ncbi:MAG: hypothetical protein PUJ57_06140 [Peptoniphilaceae bacterium]|nr:hypothetical protein [Peptoniphilaceae bacterium]MDY6085732.1 hypothetical protein [Peptoniphilaceae bacterium]